MGLERSFEAAVALFDRSLLESSQNPWAVNWQYIAARDGAMTTYHFGKTINSIRMNLNRCPTMSDLADRTALGQVGHLIEQSFPYRDVIRNAVGHSAEFMGDPDRSRSHAIPIPDQIRALLPINPNAKIRISGTLIGRSFFNTVNGKLRTYELSSNSFNQLSAIKQTMYRAFLPVQTATLSGAASQDYTGST
jgi:hypothetical protein